MESILRENFCNLLIGMRIIVIKISSRQAIFAGLLTGRNWLCCNKNLMPFMYNCDYGAIQIKGTVKDTFSLGAV